MEYWSDGFEGTGDLEGSWKANARVGRYSGMNTGGDFRPFGRGKELFLS